MNIDLLNPVDRTHGDSLKWNKYAGRDILPLWVADMDFAAPPAVVEALQSRVAHGVFGYGEPWPRLIETVQQHLLNEYGWAIEPAWLVWLPGLVTGLNVACRATEGAVLTTTPVYPPFLSAPRHSGRTLVSVPLALTGEGWTWDWPAMRAAVESHSASAPGNPLRLMLLCHPHNPVGRAWREDELRDIADFCREHGLIVCSDEIHCGLILDEGRRHIPMATLGPEIARQTITLMAPSKTYNVPGLGCAFAVIPDAALRRQFVHAMQGIVPHVNVLGLTACEAAYRHGEPWRRDLIKILRTNRDRLEALVAQESCLRMHHVEATYLAWLDARGLGVDNPVAFFESHGLGLSDGSEFGAPGWVRLNFGCPPITMDEVLKRLRGALVEARGIDRNTCS